jgi:hypothetical protein
VSRASRAGAVRESGRFERGDVQLHHLQHRFRDAFPARRIAAAREQAASVLPMVATRTV